MKRKKPERNGFSLIEVCILFVVFALLAAVVVPKFSEAKTESKLTEMVSALQMMRSQIELYQIQHDDLLPGQHQEGGSIHVEDFINALTVKSPLDGFGPYLTHIPANPFVNEGVACEILFVKDATAERKVSKEHGWCFNTRTGEFYACSSRGHIQY